MRGPGKPINCQPIMSAIAAMHRVAEHAFDGVGAQQGKEDGVLDAGQDFVLLGGVAAMKTAERFEAFAVDVARRGWVLIALFRQAFLKRRLSVAVAVFAVGGGASWRSM